MLQVEIEDLDECLCEATRALFEQMLESEPLRASPPDELAAGFGAIVTIGAPTPLRLHVVMPGPKVIEMAQRVFGLSAEEVTDADCRDLMGEVANIVGGSLKGMFDDATSLSLPTSFATQERYKVPDGTLQVWFSIDGAPFGAWCEAISA